MTDIINGIATLEKKVRLVSIPALAF